MYSLLKIIVRFSLIAYFRKIKIQGKEKISKKGPYILIANHPSAFTDPISIAVNIKPTVYFLAAGEYMGGGIKYWFMHRHLNMIPVYRPETMPDQTHNNAAIFAKCIEHLNKGRSIMVFPEGVSAPERKISPLKTGTARIIRTTEIESAFKANIQIIPIGLNYSDPHKFRSDLFINVGDPITASDYLSADEDKEVEEVQKLTALMEQALIDTVLHMEDQEFDGLLNQVNDTYMRDLKSELGVDYRNQEAEFELSKLTITAFEYFQEHNPDAYGKMKDKLKNYLNLLRKHGIKEREFRKVDERTKWSQKVLLSIGAPLFLLGLIGNIIPFQLSKFLQGRINVKDTFRGSIILAIGMLIFGLWYLGFVLCLWMWTPLSYFSLLIIPLLYFSGLFSLIYQSVYTYLLKRRKLRRYLSNHDKLKSELISARKTLITSFTEMRSAFDSRQTSE